MFLEAYQAADLLLLLCAIAPAAATASYSNKTFNSVRHRLFFLAL
jgi:hypothetical protein